MTALLALTCSLLWGLADFGGGLLTRRLPALLVVVASQAAAAVLLLPAALTSGAPPVAGPRLLCAVAAGLLGPVALLCYYRALAIGPMGVVSPLATVGVVVPVGLGLLLGERPGPAQAAGIAVAVAGVALAGGPEVRGTAVGRRAVLLALVAAFGFGAVMALIAEASADGGLLQVLCVQRVLNVAVGGTALLLVARRDPAGALPPEGLWSGLRRRLPALAAVGVADVAANGAYALAARGGQVSVAAVLASLYPVATALLARGWLGERLRPVQAVGAGLALVGTVLLAAG
ncbi:EamA family transporter [Streptacidiphilus griseoplanus]|uniref:EamA family transporter n=1 Tax=Peterkaempfera griseoplana TaxID=66896 RepID=UPI0006E3FA3C|nr:EamA family transporter [Peterkaempfera griseoplana]